MATHAFTSSILVAGLTAGALSLTACAEPVDPSGDPGSLRMGLVGQDAAGNTYRLRDGVFDIDGPEMTSISTESSPAPLDTLTVELAAGNYGILLNDGWRLERWDPMTDETLDVAATLTSENPASTLINGTETSTVVFTFVVPDAGPVTLGDGDLLIDIDVDVEDPPPELVACDPLASDCPAGEGCYGYNDPDEGALLFVCAPTALEGGLYEECQFLNACSAGLACWASTANNNCDVTGVGCCLPFCEVSDPSCAAAEFCQSVGAEDPDVGFCASL